MCLCSTPWHPGGRVRQAPGRKNDRGAWYGGRIVLSRLACPAEGGGGLRGPRWPCGYIWPCPLSPCAACGLPCCLPPLLRCARTATTLLRPRHIGLCSQGYDNYCLVCSTRSDGGEPGRSRPALIPQRCLPATLGAACHPAHGQLSARPQY